MMSDVDDLVQVPSGPSSHQVTEESERLSLYVNARRWIRSCATFATHHG